MNLRNRRLARRGGFTLLELLVVVVIMSILLSLIGAAVFKAMSTGRRTTNRNDIGQLQIALETFKNRFGAYPPSRIILCENYTAYSTVPAAAQLLRDDSIAFITKMFPNIDGATWSNPGMDWNGNGTIDSGFVILEGDQCLVFFLGGIPSQPGAGLPPACQGFAANPKFPTAIMTDRIGPFFEFQSTRLVLFPPAQGSARSALHLSYLDTYGTSNGFGAVLAGQPYLYFSSYKAANGYNRYYQSLQNSDCTQANVWPYAEVLTQTSVRYLNPNSFQIVSAGADQTFGSGTTPTAGPTWTPTTASQVYPAGSPGYDDQANFTGSLLGAGQD